MTEPPTPSIAIRLADGVRLRREHHGGLAFDPRTGNTVELDRGAFRLIELTAAGVSMQEAQAIIMEEGVERGRPGKDIARVVATLRDLQLVVEAEAAETTAEPGHLANDAWPAGSPLTGPEAVHWAITYRCHAACPDCYAARHRKGKPVELSMGDALRLVDRVAEWGTFQLAIGGGEPLLREDLPAVVRRARERGLSVHVTTSGEAPGGVSDAVYKGVSCLQIGIRHDDLLSTRPAGQSLLLPQLCRRAKTHGVSIGANLILCRTVAERFEEAMERLVDAGFRRITLLRYKPPSSLARWRAEAHEPASLRGMEARIAQQFEVHPGLTLRLDCGLAFFERHLPAEVARRAGLRGCVAGARIAALGPDGSVYPCSQLVAPRFSAGNLLEASPAAIWRESPVLRKWRTRRTQRVFRQTLCGACRAVERCGGCPAMANDGLGADPGCPEPVLRPRNALGRNGRVADLRRYLDDRHTISVAEYMERYGVGQRRAVSELRRFPGLALADAKGDDMRKGAGARKTDRYELLDRDAVGRIQQMIGGTSAGFPYAAHEEIEEWIGQRPTHPSYPAWLRKPEPSRAAEHGEPTRPDNGQRRRR